VIAIALFGVMASVFLTASIGDPAGFGDASVIESIGFSLLNIADVEGTIPTEGFLAAFIVIALALDAALDGSIMLARRDEGDETGMRADGGDTGGEEE
jgi:NADH-quinone oxidoreductase subunit J